MELTIDRRYRGPLTSANRGYACGRLAAYVDADEVEVTLRLPPPLGRPLAVEGDGELVQLLDGDAVVAEAVRRRSTSTHRRPSRSRRPKAPATGTSAAEARTSASASSAAPAPTVSRSMSGRSAGREPLRAAPGFSTGRP
jgi:hypothetical protein